ncbi:MAG TPA: DUF2064 domain-containing protein [Thermomicrobiales bacterium]|nr:DUF2064 domain-containing protein [Thermomicrobiales bacterium]
MIVRRSDNLLMIAARAPHAGSTKTRLGRAIGMERAARLYVAFLADIAGCFTPPANPGGSWDLAWTHSPPDVDFRSELREAIGDAPAHVRYVPQIANQDWGRRQSALLAWGDAQGYRRTVLIASDSPQIEVAVIEDAFAALASHDVVLGRVHDGGYYLIGQRGFREILDGVQMSTASAADGVLQHARNQGLATAEVDPTFDVDVEDDLTLLIEHLAASDGTAAPATWRAMKDLGLR